MADKQFVVLTRRTWDICMAFFAQVLMLVGGFLAWWTGNLWPIFFLPLISLPLWIYLRLITPASGIRSRPIRNESPLLKFWTAWTVLYGIVLFYDKEILGHHKHDPVGWFLCVSWVGLLVVLVGGSAFIVHRWPPPLSLRTGTRDELRRLPTKALQNRCCRALALPDAPDARQEEALAPSDRLVIFFKSDPRWPSQYALLQEILAERPRA